MSAPVLFDRDGDIATVTLNRPDFGNALDMATAKALFDAAIACDLDPSIRCVVLTGTGKLFCGGGDVREFLDAGGGFGPHVNRLAAYVHLAAMRFMRMAKPMLVAVNGPAAGAGMSLALSGDIVIAARSAHFSTAYTKIGLTADGGMSWHLPRLVGMRRAQDLLMTGRRVASEEALAIGLVTAIVEDEALAGETAARARQLADSATGALGRTKALLLSSMSESLEGQLEAEVRAITQSAQGPESREGVEALMAKRRPDFKGAST